MCIELRFRATTKLLLTRRFWYMIGIVVTRLATIDYCIFNKTQKMWYKHSLERIFEKMNIYMIYCWILMKFCIPNIYISKMFNRFTQLVNYQVTQWWQCKLDRNKYYESKYHLFYFLSNGREETNLLNQIYFELIL